MKKLILVILFFLISCKGILVKSQGNLKKITKSYIEFKEKKGVFDRNKDIIVIGANSIDDKTYWMDIAFDNVNYMYNRKYSTIYNLNGYKIILFEELDKSKLFNKVFSKLPYENLNKAKFAIDYEISPWHIILNDKNEILSIKSKYSIDEIVAKLKENNVKFSKKFKE